MDMKLVNPFIVAVKSVLEQFGLSDIKQQVVQQKEELIIKKEVTAYIGVVGDLQGNVAYSYSVETAKQLASTMMMGMPVEVLDEMIKSALAELANMFAGNSSPLFEMQNLTIDVTPPSLVVGDDIFFILSFHDAVTVVLETSLGEIEVNIELEV